jgi:Tol biopolymer transport system component
LNTLLFRWTTASFLLASGGALAQSTSMASINSAGACSNCLCTSPSISGDGRFVAFSSCATNLVTADTNDLWDVFVHDQLTGTTERVSVSTAGVEANDHSDLGSLSVDGRYVAFWSRASNLVAGDTNGVGDIFVRDRLSGVTERVSVDSTGVQANDECEQVTISADGRFVAFSSVASNLVAGDANACEDVFVHDRQTGKTERVSLSSTGGQGNAPSSDNYYSGIAITPDGRLVAFSSLASNLVAGDTNGSEDVFLRDRQAGTTERISIDSAGAQGDGRSIDPSISSDGRVLAFESASTNLVPGDTNGGWDVFVHDRQTGTTKRVSVDSSGNQGIGLWPNNSSLGCSISANGRYVSFGSYCTNLVPNDTNNDADCFVHDRLTGITENANVSSTGVQGIYGMFVPYEGGTSISADGRFVAFQSYAWNLVANDTSGDADIFVRDRGTGVSGFCLGDGSTIPCPCGNNGQPSHGCENSASTGGALLSESGAPSLGADSLLLSCSGELPTASSIFLQGSAAVAPTAFGDGLRCVGGNLKRLYVHSASGGTAIAPQAGDPPISQRSATLGDTLTTGAVRFYQVWYRDPSAAFCSTPAGNVWNISSGLRVVWQ